MTGLRFSSAIIFLWVALLSLTWVFVLPPFQGSDESVHFGESKLLLYTALPSFAEDPSDLTGSCSDELFALLREHRVSTIRFNPLSSYQAPLLEIPRTSNFLNDHGCAAVGPAPLYYLYNLPFLVITASLDPLTQFYILRLGAWLLLLLHLGVATRIGQLVFTSRPLQLFLPLSLGLHPIFVSAHTWVSYDGLLNLLFSLNVGVALSFMLQKGPFRTVLRFLIASAGVTALALLTKISGFAVVLPTLAAVGCADALALSPVQRRKLWGALLVLFGGSVLVLLNLQTPSWQSLLSTLRSENLRTTLWQLLVERPWLAFESFWGGGGFGWLDTYAPPVFLALFAALTLLGLTGAVKLLWRRRPEEHQTRQLVTFSLLVVVAFEGLALAYNLFLPPVGMTETGFVQGRYYFPLMIPFLLLLYYGGTAWGHPTPRRSAAFCGAFLLLMLLYHLFYLNAVLIPRYYF